MGGSGSTPSGSRSSPWHRRCAALPSRARRGAAAITLDSVALLDLFDALLLLILGLALLVAFVFIEKRIEQPMLDLSLFRIRAFSAGNIASLLNSLARGAVTLVLTFYLQGPSMGLDALSAGLFLIPISISLALLGRDPSNIQ